MRADRHRRPPHRSKVPTSANTPNGKTRSASAFAGREEALLVSDMRLSLMNSIDRPNMRLDWRQVSYRGRGLQDVVGIPPIRVSAGLYHDGHQTCLRIQC